MLHCIVNWSGVVTGKPAFFDLKGTRSSVLFLFSSVMLFEEQLTLYEWGCLADGDGGGRMWDGRGLGCDWQRRGSSGTNKDSGTDCEQQWWKLLRPIVIFLGGGFLSTSWTRGRGGSFCWGVKQPSGVVEIYFLLYHTTQVQLTSDMG